MALQMKLSLLLIIISTSCINATESDAVYCDTTYDVELKESLTLQCSIRRVHESIYWFRGTDISAVPFIWLEEEVDGEGLGEYNMTNDGALVIKSASLHHEGIYTVWVYFQDGTYKTAETNVLVTIAPNPPCPIFNTLCNATCPSSCSVEVSGDGEILCSINGSRPKVAIDCNISGQSGISFNVHEAEFAHNADIDTWNTTLKLDYTLDDSAGEATIQCVASERFNLETPGATVKLYYYEIGKDEPTVSPTPNEVDGGFAVIIIIVILIVVVAAVISLLFCVVRRRQQNSRGERTETNGDKEKGSGEEMEPLTDQPQKSQSTEDRREMLLIRFLRGLYEKECFIKPLPWDEPLPISSFYTPCDCKIGQRQTNTDELFSSTFQFDHNRVLIIADLGYGKTTFTKHVVNRWRAGRDEQNIILIYVLLKEVNEDTRLSEYVLHMLPPGTKFSVAEIEDILQINDCHVLLDGLDELSMSTSDPLKTNNIDDSVIIKCAKPDDGSESKNETFWLTISHLLSGSIPLFYKKVNVWVTSRKVDDTNSRFELPYARVTLSGFSDSQLNEYITKVCKHYLGSRQTIIADSTLGRRKTDVREEHVSMGGLIERVKDTPAVSTLGHTMTGGGKEHANAGDLTKGVEDSTADLTLGTGLPEGVGEQVNGAEPAKGDDGTAKDSTLGPGLQESGEEQVNTGEPANEDKDTAKYQLLCPGLPEGGEEQFNAGESAKGDEDTVKEPTLGSRMADSGEKRVHADEPIKLTRDTPTNPTPSPVLTEYKEEHVNTEEITMRVKDTLEYNEISKEFAATPLLLIMIIHIVTSKIVHPIGRMKNVQLKKMTTIVQMVITCLESRYIQKIHERKDAPEELATLEEKLGRLALRKRLEDVSVSTKDISKEDIDIALAVGLLRLTKDVTGNSGTLAVSSFSGIRFYHPYFLEYFAAKNARFNDEETELTKIVKGGKDDQTIRLLQFMAGSNHPRLQYVLNILLNKHEMWNNFVDCIYEIGSNTKQEETIKYFKKDIEEGRKRNVRYLYKKYHKEAVSTYFDLCKRTNIKINIVTFREDAAVDLLQHLALPVIDKFILFELTVEEDNFVNIIEYISRKDNIPRNIGFISCVVPEKLSDSAKRRIRSACKQKKLQITKGDLDILSISETFSLTTFRWRVIPTKAFDGIHKKLLEQASPTGENQP